MLSVRQCVTGKGMPLHMTVNAALMTGSVNRYTAGGTQVGPRIPVSAECWQAFNVFAQCE